MYYLLKKEKMSSEELGFWTLPKPDMFVKNWKRLPRVARTVPFGYEVDEEDEDFLADLNRRKTRQEEIKAQLQQFLKIRKADKMLADESLNMIKELRRLSLRPKSR